MQRKPLFVLFVVGLLTFALALPAFAATSEFSGTLTHESPFLEGTPVADGDACDSSDTWLPEFGVHYNVIDFNAPVTGEYEYINYINYGGEELGGAAGGKERGTNSRSAVPEGELIDVTVQIYADGTFDPSDTLANCLGAGDDYRTFDLAAGNYDIVVISYYDDDTGPYYFTITGPDAESPACTNPQPTDAVIYNIPAGAPTFYEPSLGASTGFNLPAGTWYVSEFSGDFAQVWISCQADFVWVPTNAVAR